MYDRFQISRQFYQARLTQKLNGWIYWLKRAPIIGKSIPNALYREYQLKQVLLIFVLVFSAIKKQAAKFLWLLIYYLLGCLTLGNNVFPIEVESFKVGLLLWFFVVIVYKRVNPLFSQKIDYSIIEYLQRFQISYSKGIETLRQTEVFVNLLAYIIPALIFGALAKMPLKTLLFIAIAFLGTLSFSQWVNQKTIDNKLFEKHNKVLNLIFLILVFMINVIIVYFKCINLLFSWPALLILSLLSIYFIISSAKSKNYKQYYIRLAMNSMNHKSSFSKMFNKEKKNTYLQEGLRMQNNLVLDKEEGRFSGYSGTAMLNELLFHRYRK